MDFYVAQNGERRGPFRIFQIKEMLESGEVSPRDWGWHTGLTEWRPLEEIEALSSFMPRQTPPPLPEVEEQEAGAWGPSRLPSGRFGESRAGGAMQGPSLEPEIPRWELFYRRALPRFLARLFDTTLFFALSVGVAALLKLLPWNALVFPPFWFVPAQALAWVVVEAWLLSRFATTPGKWIFNLTVQHPVEGPPRFSRALKRTFFIWVCAWGFGFPGWAIFGSGVALLLYLYNGRMVWDYLVSTDVVHGPARPGRWVAPLMFFIAYWTVRVIILFTQPWPEWVSEEQRRQFEELKAQMRQANQPSTRR